MTSRRSEIPVLNFADISKIRSPGKCCEIVANGNAGERSILLARTSFFRSLVSLNILKSSGVNASLVSSINSTRSARSRRSFVNFMPMVSTVSAVWCSPAVSINFIGIPFIVSPSSMRSRVVPGICVTIARSLFKSLLRRLDFPTLGRPMIMMSTPSL